MATKTRETALLLENIHTDAAQALRKAGYKVIEVPTALGENELIKALKGCSVLGIRSKTQVTRRVLDATPQLTVIGAFCIGTNQIDLQAASERGIAVFNAPFSNTRSVVELVLAEMIMLFRKAADKSAKAHAGVWDKSAEGSFEVRGKTLGIVGYGNIGAQLSVLAENLGMHVVFFDVEEKLALGNAERCKSLAELLKKADVVTLHIDGRTANTRIIGTKELSLMKRGAYLLNLSRGHVVDVEALARALKSGRLAGAAVDVFPKEPKGNGEKFRSPLQKVPNVILTPHIGGSTKEAQVDIAHHVSHRLIQYRDTGATTLSVNMPVIKSVKWKNTRRIAHIHQNIPGVLAAINDVFSLHHINILGQHLNTNDTIGYCITDVAPFRNDKIVKSLATITGTIRSRLVY